MRSACLPIDELDAATKASMADLLGQHFVGATPNVFDKDLADKTHAVVLLDDKDKLMGFSTFAIYTATGPDGAPATIVCSGDTIVATQARRSSILLSVWIQAVHKLHAKTKNVNLYWLLMTSGYRTYRFLPVFVKSYYPGIGQTCDAAMIDCMHRLAAQRWADQYEPELGIVRLVDAQPLQPHLREVPAGRKTDPHIAFFLDRNPGHACGEELVSLAKLNVSNLTPAGLRMLRTQPANATSESAHR
jgi:hypothetical protein